MSIDAKRRLRLILAVLAVAFLASQVYAEHHKDDSSSLTFSDYTEWLSAVRGDGYRFVNGRRQGNVFLAVFQLDGNRVAICLHGHNGKWTQYDIRITDRQQNSMAGKYESSQLIRTVQLHSPGGVRARVLRHDGWIFEFDQGLPPSFTVIVEAAERDDRQLALIFLEEVNLGVGENARKPRKPIRRSATFKGGGVSIDIGLPNEIAVGSKSVVKVVARNERSHDIVDLELRIYLPSELRATLATFGVASSSGAYSWHLDRVGPGESVVREIQVEAGVPVDKCGCLAMCLVDGKLIKCSEASLAIVNAK